MEENYDYASLFRRKYETSVIDERQDGDISITCSINIAQTENKVLEAGSQRDKRCMVHLCHFSQLRSKNHTIIRQTFLLESPIR